MNFSGKDAFSASMMSNDGRYGYTEDPRLSDVDKDAIIISMQVKHLRINVKCGHFVFQDKIDRLRDKLNAVIENAQDIMLEAQNERV